MENEMERKTEHDMKTGGDYKGFKELNLSYLIGET